MPAAPMPLDEPFRLQALRELDVLDSAPEEAFTALVQAAAEVCGVPVSLISLVDEDRQWFKAHTGLAGTSQTPRDTAFCAWSILQDELLEVEDAAADPRFADNPLVRGQPGIRFYAGAPLRLGNGARVGTLCVINHVPQRLSDSQRSVLRHLARAAVQALEGRRALQAERLVREERELSEARLRVLSEGSPLGIFATDAHGACTYTNARWQEIYGLAGPQCRGHGWTAALHPEDRDGVVAEWHHCTATQAEFSMDFRLLRRDGQTRYVHSAARPVLNASAELDGFIGSVQDITSRIETHARLAISERRLRTLYESTPGMLCTIDPQGRLVMCSDVWLHKLGYARAQVIGRPVVDFLSPASREKSLSEVRPQLLAQGRCQDIAYQMVTQQGSLMDVLVSSIVEHDEHGRAVRILSVIEDITERLQSRRALQQERRRLASIIDGTGAGTWELNVATGETRINERWAEIVGHRLDELTPTTLDTRTRLAHPDELTHSRELLRRHLEGELDHYEDECRLRHRDGHWVWVRSRGRVVTRDADGRALMVYGVLEDISQRKQQEAALRKSEALLARTGEIAGIGGWELDLLTDTLSWSPETRRIHAVPPDYVPTLEAALDFYAPEGRPLIQAAVAQAIGGGASWDLELPLVDAAGRPRWVRALGHADFQDGRAVHVSGAFQDVTERVLQRQALEYAHERIALATESGGIGVWEWQVPTRSLVWDGQMHRLFGLPAQGWREDPESLWAEHLHPADRPATERAMRDALDHGQPYDTEFRIVWRDGSVRHLRASARVVRDADGKPLRMVGVNWDVTQIRNLAQALDEQRELLQVTLQSIGDAVITTDAAGRVNWLNPVAERLTGWLNEESRGRPLAQVFHVVNEQTRQPAENPVARCLQQGKAVSLAQPTLLVSRSGEEFGIEDSAAPITNARGVAMGVVLVFHDVTEQRRLSGEMSYRATHDALTGLVNRAEFENRLRQVLHEAHEHRSDHALMYIDLDQFKLVNDACGHSAGDQLLQQVSKLMAKTVRSRDTLARLGGDEFAVILERCTIDQAQRVAQQLCAQMEEFRFVHDGQRFRIGTSIGLVPVDRRWNNTAAILQAADTSCYAAKEAGRNRVHTWFDTDLAMRARQGETQWASRIAQALDEDRFVLHAQRIEPLADGAPGVHAEVLLRLVEPDGTLVPPGAFLPAAERFHLASRVDRWVLQRALQWLAVPLHAQAVDTLCVNLSGQSVGDRAFHRHALDALRLAGPALCRRLCLEITETAAITHLADASLFIEQLRELGVRLALDDFGAGASSFGYLKTLKVDYLKIDGQFIQDLIDDPLDAAAVRCFADVAKVVGVRTVAEFVDCPAVLARVREIGIDFAQGFLLHRPEPLDQLLTSLDCAAVA